MDRAIVHGEKRNSRMLSHSEFISGMPKDIEQVNFSRSGSILLTVKSDGIVHVTEWQEVEGEWIRVGTEKRREKFAEIMKSIHDPVPCHWNGTERIAEGQYS